VKARWRWECCDAIGRLLTADCCRMLSQSRLQFLFLFLSLDPSVDLLALVGDLLQQPLNEVARRGQAIEVGDAGGRGGTGGRDRGWEVTHGSAGGGRRIRVWRDRQGGSRWIWLLRAEFRTGQTESGRGSSGECAISNSESEEDECDHARRRVRFHPPAASSPVCLPAAPLVRARLAVPRGTERRLTGWGRSTNHPPQARRERGNREAHTRVDERQTGGLDCGRVTRTCHEEARNAAPTKFAPSWREVAADGRQRR
jgi:hypothetical protein